MAEGHGAVRSCEAVDEMGLTMGPEDEPEDVHGECSNEIDNLKSKVAELEGEVQEYKDQLEAASSALEEIKEISARAWREITKV